MRHRMVRESDGRPQEWRGAPRPAGRYVPDREEREDRFARVEEFTRRTLAAADFPVYGVVAGLGREGDALAAFETSGGQLDWVEVQSGDWSSVTGPYVTVRTYRPGAERCVVLPELEDVVEDERDRVYDHLGVDEGDGPGRVRALREWITVDGEPCAVEVHEDRPVLWPGAPVSGGAGPVWAGRLRIDGLTVTVCGRGVAPGGLELGRIGDVERYLRGRSELLRGLASRHALRVPVEERELPPVSGLEAHRTLIGQSIAESAAIDAQVRAGRPPRLPRGLRGEARAVSWEAAVRQQMRLASETREEALAAVTSMVNHFNRLAQQTHWVVGTPEGAAAVEEAVRYTVFASEVASLPAQRAWEQLWRDRAGGGPEAWEEQRLAEQLWLSAWEQWRAARVG
ncbi:hypothetical protein KV557_10230 [Kitasatospora aureofaciens]|uniref:hypothetical protein n=1 Tax=Kitasatospora aureofaciens TaxID=1894 RepID=UPI001C4721CC|nr:hypothetical protein [Kitasatospora aureofaciens]MBV6697502.1 hypothetical protein [Kitasatospora aureofaciens]